MQPNLTMVLEQVGKDKGIDKQVLVSTLEQAILTAAKKVFGETLELEAQFNTETGQVDLFQICVVTDSLPLSLHPAPANLKQVSIAPMLGEAIRRIHRNESVSFLFRNGQKHDD